MLLLMASQALASVDPACLDDSGELIEQPALEETGQQNFLQNYLRTTSRTISRTNCRTT